MGLLSDTLEDTKERIGQIEMIDRLPLAEPLPIKKPKVCCPVCNAVLGNDLGLQNHLRREHANEQVYLKVNDRIARSADYFELAPKSCLLVILGSETAEVTVKVGNRRTKQHVVGEANLLSLLSGAIGEVNLTVVRANQVRKYAIYFVTPPPFDRKPLEKEIHQLQSALECGDEPNWRSYQKAQRILATSELENQYLDGFFEYSLGLHLEKSGDPRSGTEHLESATELLRPFDTVLARTARRILAIRMNCFRPLASCHASSIFWQARQFFLENRLQLLEDTTKRGIRSDCSLYTDFFTDQILSLIKTYYARDMVNVHESLARLHGHPLAKDQNNLDKLLLIEARAHEVCGDLDRARRVYEEFDRFSAKCMESTN
jgi:hypothetical protein